MNIIKHMHHYVTVYRHLNSVTSHIKVLGHLSATVDWAATLSCFKKF